MEREMEEWERGGGGRGVTGGGYLATEGEDRRHTRREGAIVHY